MARSITKGQFEPLANAVGEVVVRGRSVSRGIAIGKVLCLYGNIRQFYRKEINEGEITNEIERFRQALRTAGEQIVQLAQTEKATATASMLDVQRLMLDDAAFTGDIVDVIEQKRVNSEWAVKEVAANYIARFKALTDERLRERYIDIEDVSDRIVTVLGESAASDAVVGSDSVIASHELRPSSLSDFSDPHPAALISEHGGWTSHTFILARELEIPAVAGIKRLLRRIKTGDTVIVDGYDGLVVLHPTKETRQRYSSEGRSRLNPQAKAHRDACCSTLDGREITIRANLDVPAVYDTAARLGAKGIGLYRSEFLFNQFRGFPSENDQFRAYRAIAEFAGDDGVRIRTFDVGASQLLSGNRIREKNPALGLRAIRLSVAQEEPFRDQIRAILRASAGHRIDVIIPMVNGPSEIQWARSILAEEAKQLEAEGTAVGSPQLGAMIEVPSAVFMIEELLEESDFISLGTNDLVQYLLAADRDNEAVSDWFRTLHPAVIRALGGVVAACDRKRKPLIICGEMAGSPYYVPVLIGLGATEFSMSINSISRVRRVISGIAFDEAAVLVEKMTRCRNASDAEALLSEQIGRHWAHLFAVPHGESFVTGAK